MSRPGMPSASRRSYKSYVKAALDEGRDDPWSSLSALAALDSVSDPAVIPWLARMLAYALLNGGVEPIDKFHDVEAGRLALAKRVRVGDPKKAAWALVRLGEWGHHLAVEAVRPFLASAKAWSRSQALGYLRSVRDDRYRALRPEVARLAEADAPADAMPALAVLGIWAEAKEAVPGRLIRAVAGLDAAKGDDVRLVLDAAAAWRPDAASAARHEATGRGQRLGGGRLRRGDGPGRLPGPRPAGHGGGPGPGSIAAPGSGCRRPRRGPGESGVGPFFRRSSRRQMISPIRRKSR